MLSILNAIATCFVQMDQQVVDIGCSLCGQTWSCYILELELIGTMLGLSDIVSRLT